MAAESAASLHGVGAGDGVDVTLVFVLALSACVRAVVLSPL